MTLISFLLKAASNVASVKRGIVTGFVVVFLTTSSHNSFSFNTSKIRAFHETKFTAPSNISSVLNPMEVIFLKEEVSTKYTTVTKIFLNSGNDCFTAKI